MQLSLFTNSSCDHRNVVEQKEPEGNIHYARLTCQDCGRFIKWISKPKVAETSIVRLLLNPNLEKWQEQFLKAIVYRKQSKAEKIVVDAIAAKVGLFNQT